MYIGTMFIQVKQNTKNPEAGSWHQCTQIYTVVIGYPRSFLIWVIKFIRGSSPLKRQSSPKKRIHTWNFQIYITNCLLGLVMTNNCYTRAAFSKASTHERSPTEQQKMTSEILLSRRTFAGARFAERSTGDTPEHSAYNHH